MVVCAALENLRRTSRTANGVSDTSSSADKPKLVVAEGSALASATENLVRTTLEWLLDRELERPSAEQVRSLIVDLAERMIGEVLAPGQSIFRTWETKFEMQTRLADLDAEFDRFCEELAARLQDGDAVSTAAWVERRIDAVVHPFADGCGKISKALSAWVLYRAGVPLPIWESRESYLSHLIAEPTNPGLPESFLAYYRSRIER